MHTSNIKLGFAITGSFCTFAKIPPLMETLRTQGYDLYPICSYATKDFNTRFGDAAPFLQTVETIAGKKAITTIQDAEPIGPKALLDLLLIAPCTGNTLAKLAHGITDTPVLMAAKAHLRNQRPVVIYLSTNDALGANLQNIGQLLNTKHVYFVPFGQDDYAKKPNSLISVGRLVPDTLTHALSGRQLHPLLVPYL